VEAVARLRERAERILNGVPLAIVALDRAGTPTALNPALETAFPGARTGSDLAAVFPNATETELAQLSAAVETARSSGRPARVDIDDLRLGGADRQYTVEAIPIEAGSEDVATLLLIEDQSRVRELQAQLLRTEKLSTVGVLTAGLAHEIGTPLGVIRGRAEYTLQKLGEHHPQAAGLAIIVEQIDRVSRLIRSVLDFASRREVGRQAVHIGAVFSKVRDLVALTTARRNLALELDAPESLPAVRGDEDQLLQVVLNLVINALDASTDGGRVRLHARVHTLDPGGQAMVRVRVVDEGAGIAPENIHRVFDPFFTTKKRGQGTGLGLAVVAQIVHDHGGEVRAQSAASRGTAIEFDLPIGGTHA
jgi:two-component system, NtrC family, sensor histidine kinase HydH